MFSLFAFALFCNTCARYIAYVPFQIIGVLATLPLIYFIVYVTYKLLIWTKAHCMCKKHILLESQESDRLLCPEEYGTEEESKPHHEEGDSDHCPHNTETETYPPCGNSQQPRANLYDSLT